MVSTSCLPWLSKPSEYHGQLDFNGLLLRIVDGIELNAARFLKYYGLEWGDD